MRRGTLIALTSAVVLSAALAGCTGGSDRDIESEARDREAWAKDHRDYAPIPILSGPAKIAPGALVWFSAYGSHDPDFFGASKAEQRREAKAESGVHYTDNATSVHWGWYGSLERDASLGVGIKEYRWRIDDGPILVAHELTHRYGLNDGPIRIPVGFLSPGMHRVSLTVVDWSDAKNSITADVEVVDGGQDSQIPGWSVTEAGWTFVRDTPVSWQQYGECPAVGPSHYDAVVHEVAVPFELLFFMDHVIVKATWDQVRAPAGIPLGHNLNDIDLTLGHCEVQPPWARFATDTTLTGGDLEEGGEVDGLTFARNVVVDGPKTERLATWTFNAYLSDEGNGQWGSGIDVAVGFTFVPSSDTAYGGQ